MQRLSVLVVLALSLAACGGSNSPAAPPTPSPTPQPQPPSPTPSANPYAAACGSPLPPFASSYGFGVKVQLEPSRSLKVLNASPLIRNADYCQAAGLPGTICNTRFEYLPERVPCDHYLSGMSETGRPGPNWFQRVGGRLLRCGGQGLPAEAPSCTLKDSNQYLLDVRAGGTYVACGGAGSPGTCGSCVLDDSVFGTVHQTPAGLCGLE
jgi:hypothetical protein